MRRATWLPVALPILLMKLKMNLFAMGYTASRSLSTQGILMDHFRILASASEADVCHVAAMVLQLIPDQQVKLRKGPQAGLLMARVRESVTDSQFNAGEVLVTEVEIDFADQLGYGMVLGDSPRRATAVAIIDAALQRPRDVVSDSIESALVELERQNVERNRQLYAIVAQTNVAFETF